MFIIPALRRAKKDQLLRVGLLICEFENRRTNVAGVMMPFDQHSVNTCVLRTATTFEDFVQV
jgi:hypothetical protein